MTDRWLAEMLVAKGVMSESGLLFRAGVRTHRPCRRACLAGIDDSGLDTWCDLRELSRDGELHALLAGRRTWDLYAGRGLTIRRSSAIAYRPAGDRRRPVFAEHRCHQPLPADWCLPPATSHQPPRAATERIPF